MRFYAVLIWLLLSSSLFLSTLQSQEKRYKNPNLPFEERTIDLLKRMTIEEKVGQLLCPLGWGMYAKEGKQVSCSDDYKKQINQRHTGMFWATFRADPWTKKTLENGLNPEQSAIAANALQRYAIENSRLGIPVFLAEEAPHGHMAIGATVFPSSMGQAATFNPELMEAMGHIIAKEIRLQGAHIGYGPVLDLARDPRWSRVEETYGEDPVLSAVMGAAMVKGMGAGKLAEPYSVISTLKHFVAYGVPESGQNGNPSVVGIRDLHENFLPPFKAAIDAGALSVMTAYNSMDGVPCTMNESMLKDVLRKQWGFKGFTVSDLYSIEGIKDSHRIVETLAEAAQHAACAGVDVDLGGDAFATLVATVKEGKMPEAVLDSAVSHVLRLKFQMGLFEHPYVDPIKAKQEVRNAEHRSIARKMAQQSVVLLENKKQLLPLNKKSKIAVIGPNADNQYNMLGDYTAPQEEATIITVLEGITAHVNKKQITYVKGCAIRDTLNTQIDEAVKAARSVDVAVIVVGGSSARDFRTSYKETGAAIASQDYVSDMESGEGYDRASLDLLGKQMELLRAVKTTGTPMIVIYIQGRPLNMNWAKEHADALLTAWYPGQEGGNAIADVLFGHYNPSGRLPISIPKHVGQLPVYYNKKNPKSHDYVEMEATPLYSFGYGKGFSSFAYENLHIDETKNKEYKVTFDLRNEGDYDGTEVVQLYVRDEYASVVQPQKQLKAFKQVSLKKGESQKVTLTICEDDLSIINNKFEKVVESGTFTIMLGAASNDIRLTTSLNIK